MIIWFLSLWWYLFRLKTFIRCNSIRPFTEHYKYRFIYAGKPQLSGVIVCGHAYPWHYSNHSGWQLECQSLFSGWHFSDWVLEKFYCALFASVEIFLDHGSSVLDIVCKKQGFRIKFLAACYLLGFVIITNAFKVNANRVCTVDWLQHIYVGGQHSKHDCPSHFLMITISLKLLTQFSFLLRRWKSSTSVECNLYFTITTKPKTVSWHHLCWESNKINSEITVDRHRF